MHHIKVVTSTESMLDSEDDPKSILSLPHNLLQSDNGPSTSTQAMEKSQQDWLEGSSIEGTSSSSGNNGHFSAIAPSLSYNNLSQIGSNQLTTNTSTSKYYVSNTNVFPSGHISQQTAYVRPEHRGISTSFSGPRLSMSNSVSSASNVFEFSTTSLNHSDSNNEISDYYQTPLYRNSMTLYNSRVSMDVASNNFMHSNNRQFDDTETINPIGVGHGNYEHGSTDNLDNSVETQKSLNRHQQLQTHQNSTSVMEFSEPFFDARSKQLDYSKDQSDMYSSESSSTKTNSVMFSHEVPASIDKRQLDQVNNLVPEFDFSIGTRDFDSVSSRGNNNRSEYRAFNRSNELDYRVEHEGSSEYLSQDVMPQKHSQTFDGAVATPRKISTYSKKPMDDSHSEIIFVSKEQMSGSRSSDPHKFHSDGKKILETSYKEENNEQSSSSQNVGKVEEMWSGRSRPHRKMARLLGQGNHKPEKHQDNNSCHEVFLRNVYNAAEYESSFHESNKSQDVSSKSISHHEPKFRDPHGSSGNVKTIPRNLNQVDKLRNCDRGDVDSGKIFNSVRDFNNTSTLTMSNTATSLASLIPHQHFLSSSGVLNLDIQQSLAPRDIELNPLLQVSKDLEMEENLTENVSQVEMFDHHMDPHQIAPTNFPFAENLNSQCTQDINLESYLISADKDNSSLNKKFPYHSHRNLSAEAEFNIEEYMEGQVDKELTQTYFDRTDVPQDMTMYQKISPEKSTSHNSVKMKDRGDCVQNYKTVPKQTENLCDLQKELTKSSSKMDSMKGIRIPRDINRAMEILQDLQETEKEEDKRKKELDRQQQHNEIQGAQHLHQPQQQQQKYQQNVSINSSPKKTFQNKHQLESMALTEHQLLNMPTNFIEDQSVENVNFLDQSSYCFPEQSAGTSAFCDSNLQEISQYSGFSTLYQPPDVDATVLSCKPRDYQQSSGYQVTQDLDYHTLSNAKDIDTNISSLQTSSWLTGNSTQAEPDINLNNLGMSHLPEHLGLLHESQGQPNKFTIQSSIEDSRTQTHHETYTNGASQHRSSLDPDKFQNFSFADADLSAIDTVPDKMSVLDVIDASRQNLYIMMKQEQLCDAILSTSKLEVKVHQTILCSMSQYLSSLLLPPPGQSHTPIESKPSSRSSFPQSSKLKNKNHHHHASHHHRIVMLIINGDNIKSSSISAFLMYIYLGKTEFSESNILDLFILASSLHVSTLKNLCLEFMWQAHISEDDVKIPQLQISKTGVEMRDQSSYANFGTKKSVADKSVFAGPSPSNMDVASQTDRRTSKVGGGGQEEWVMLKKTKQKTVSPSKSKTSLSGKGLLIQENQPIFKPGKKPWLSPKRRFKSELLAQAKSDQYNAMKLRDKDGVGEELMENSNLFVPRYDVLASKRPRMMPIGRNTVLNEQEIQEEVQNNSDIPQIRHIKTTVEIAQEAAAAKLSCNVRKSNPSFSSSSDVNCSNHKILINSQDKKNLTIQKGLSHPELLEFRQTNPEPSALNQDLGIFANDTHNYKQTQICQDEGITHNCALDDTNNSLLVSEKLVKKKIIQQEEKGVSENFLLDSARDSLQQCNRNINLSEEKSIAESSVFNSSCTTDTNADYSVINEGDLSHVSCFIDSIMNKMGSETEEAELQKVIHDLDSELCRPQTTILSSSGSLIPSSSMSSFTSATLDGLSVSSTSFTSTSLVTTTTTATTTITTPATSNSKSKSTAQGFRKRLIQLVKSENLKLSSLQMPDTTENVPIGNFRGHEASPNDKLAEGMESERLFSLLADFEKSKKDKVDDLTPQCFPGHGKAPEETVSVTATNKGKDGTLTDDYDTHFHHKIFKRKRKSKPRKVLTNEGDNMTSTKLKTKKSLGCEPEGSGIKTRQRRNTTSDTEGGGGTRVKTKKTVPSESDGTMIRNVRPPPKKRAKMERELLKVAGDEREKNDKIESDKGVQRDKDVSHITDKDNSEIGTAKSEDQKMIVKGTAAESGSKALERSKDEISKTNGTKLEKVPKSGKSNCKKPIKKNLKVNKLGSSDAKESPKTKAKESSELTKEECEYANQLQNLFVQSGLERQIFSCKLCRCTLKSAIFSVKHLVVMHKFQGEEILQNISMGFDESSHEACDICGYVTKDKTYKYMHYHKYFKHNVPLPQGLSVHKCELCNREFQTIYMLNEHIKGHADDFSFTCWYCGQSFKSRNNMNNHVFHVHSKQRNHMCKICHKAFKTWTQLKVHVRIHTGDRPFSCPECEYGSTTLGNMRHHLFHRHRMMENELKVAIDKISEIKPEMTPTGLDKLMEMVLTQTIPDKAKKLIKKAKDDKPSKAKNKKNKVLELSKSASGDQIIGENESLPASSVKKSPALKESIARNCTRIPLSHSSIVKNRPQKLSILCCKTEAGTHSTVSTQESSSLSTLTQHKSLAIISQPILANNIVIIPAPTTIGSGHQQTSSKHPATSCNQTSAASNSDCQGVNDKSLQSLTSSSNNPGNLTNPPTTLQNSTLITESKQHSTTNPCAISSVVSIPGRTNETVVTSSTNNSKNESFHNATHPQPLLSNNMVLMPILMSGLNGKPYDSNLDMTQISTVLPSTDQMVQPGSGVVYTNQSIMLQNPMIAGDGSMYTSLPSLPSLVMYSCQPSQPVPPIQQLQILTPADLSSGMVHSSGECSSYQTEGSAVTTANSSSSDTGHVVDGGNG